MITLVPKAAQLPLLLLKGIQIGQLFLLVLASELVGVCVHEVLEGSGLPVEPLLNQVVSILFSLLLDVVYGVLATNQVCESIRLRNPAHVHDAFSKAGFCAF